MALSDKDLKGKIFTFDKSLSGMQMDDMVGQDMNFQSVLKDLQASEGIDAQDMITFKFFKISRSKVITLADQPEKTMLALVDIS